MMRLLHDLGWREFPWTVVIVWVLIGLVAALGTRLMLWRKESPGIHIDSGLALMGTFVGAFLGICYYVVVQHCGFTFCPGYSP